MKILMLGWEYPPKISGGLGIASQGLAESLALQGHEVSFLLPKTSESQINTVTLINASDIQPFQKKTKSVTTPEKWVTYLEIGTRLLPYIGEEHFVNTKSKVVAPKKITIEESIELLDKIKLSGTYGPSLMDEIVKYGVLACQLPELDTYDIIHCHDWMTFKAGEAISHLTGIPFVAHFHSTEAERNGNHPHPEIQAIEQSTCQNADLLLSVSQKTATVLRDKYGAQASKVQVLPNGYPSSLKKTHRQVKKVKKIGFIGRLTEQKNPKKFIDIARLLSSYRQDLKFVMVGDGHLMESLRNQIGRQNLEANFELTGFLPHHQTLDQLAGFDLLVVPSSHEPFGLVPLEAVRSGVPVIAAENCGIGEFIPSMLSIQPWNDHEWVVAMNQLLDDTEEAQVYIDRCYKESKQLNWDRIAKKATNYYQQIKPSSHA